MSNHADLLDLDAEVLHAYLSDAISWALAATPEPPRRILDLGTGTGTGAIALTQRLPEADVIAVDSDAEQLQHLAAKGHARITTLEADLDTTWPTIDPVDLVWASMSMHHLAHPDRVLTDVRRTLRPGGVLAVAELTSPLRFLPDDALENRCHAALAAQRAHSMPHFGADWAPLLTKAGFTEVTHRTFTLELRPPHTPATRHYADRTLRGLRGHDFPPADLEALDRALATLPTTDNLILRGTRTLWLGHTS